MTPARDLVVLVERLDPSPELGSTLELLAWLRSTRPSIAVRLIARSGGSWAERASKVATVIALDAGTPARVATLLQRARLAPAARLVRRASLRRMLAVGAVPVLVDASAGQLLHWLDPAAGPVVAHVHRDGPTIDQLDAAARDGVEQRATTTATGLDLQPQGSDRDDQPGIAERGRAELAQRLGAPDGTRWALIAAEPGELIPGDDAVAAAWALLAGRPSLHVIWLVEPCSSAALALIAAHLRDTGLGERIHTQVGNDQAWRAIAAADAVITSTPAAASGDTSGAIELVAAGRIARAVAGARDDQAVIDAAASMLDADIPRRPEDETWHAAVSGPEWLRLLGLGA